MKGRWAIPVGVAALAMGAYFAIGLWTFKPPKDLAEGARCGFSAADFSERGAFLLNPTSAYLHRFVHQRDYLTMLSLGLALGFLLHALFRSVEQRSAKIGELLGGSVAVALILCTGCVLPVLAAAGIGAAAGTLLPVPKEVVFGFTLGGAWVGARWLKRREEADEC